MILIVLIKNGFGSLMAIVRKIVKQMVRSVGLFGVGSSNRVYRSTYLVGF